MKIKVVDYTSSNAPKDFVQSIKDTGFGVLTFTGIPQRLIHSVYSDFEVFFHDDKRKMSRLFATSTQEGYFPFKSENAKDYPVKDLKEFYHYYPNRLTGDPVSPYTRHLTNKLQDLGQEILTWLQEAYPKQSTFNWADSTKKSQSTLFRVLHYPPLDGTEEKGAVRAAAHGDINLITLLVSSNAAGLQAQDRDGNWHDVGTDKSCVIVNVGDMMSEATDGYYPSTVHRVVNPVGENVSRYSMPLFMHPNSETRLSERLTAGQFLEQRLKELGLK